jgi:WD40 repeat protein
VVTEKLSRDKLTSITVVENTQDGTERAVTTSMDGFVKSVELPDSTSKKSYFVCESGINAAVSLSKTDSFALAAQNHHLYLFSFVTGTVVANFYAHDDTINEVLFCEGTKKLVTCSADQTVRLWDLGKGGDF